MNQIYNSEFFKRYSYCLVKSKSFKKKNIVKIFLQHLNHWF